MASLPEPPLREPPRPMNGEAEIALRASRPSSASTFGALDFGKLWQGRNHVTQVEQALLAGLLASADRRRVLEAGVGVGRLTATILSQCEEYFGMDLTPGFVGEARRRHPTPRGRWAIADVSRLPFRDRAFTTVVLIRVFNFLADPESTLRELGRCLEPGGTLIASYHPHPSLGTFVDDLKIALGPSRERRRETMTFSRRDVVEVHPSSFPTYSPTRARFATTASAAGFLPARELASGLEDNRFSRRLPPGLFVRLGTVFARAGGFPLYIAALRRAA